MAGDIGVPWIIGSPSFELVMLQQDVVAASASG
jgi:hypothetical protein